MPSPRPRNCQGQRTWARTATVSASLWAAAVAAGCSGRQSALAPASRAADDIADLFWGMTIGAGAIWAGMIALTFYAIRTRSERERTHHERRSRLLIVGGGVIFPTVVLSGLLVYGLSMLPPLLAAAPPGSLKIHVVGEQWWWRVTYQPEGAPDDAAPVVTANEIRLPIGEPVEFALDSPDVIHAFWIPSLGGKIDMIPGRRTRLVLEPTRTGTFRGVCAEYCGASHAWMAFDVVVMEKADFARWLDEQRAPAATAPATALAQTPDSPATSRWSALTPTRLRTSAPQPRVEVNPLHPERQKPEPDAMAADIRTAAPLIARGHEQFFANGCAACHTVRGTPARGVIGPDLTHVGSRLSLGAGVLPNDVAGFARWLAHTDEVKPGVLMPHFGMLPAEEIQALATYLDSLQ